MVLDITFLAVTIAACIAIIAWITIAIATCVAIATDGTDRQTAVENCLGYDEHECRRCNPGHDLISYNLYDVSQTTQEKRQKIQICVDRQDKLAGCNEVSELENCESCDARNGYWAKDVILNNKPSSTQSQVCVNSDETTTELGMFSVIIIVFS